MKKLFVLSLVAFISLSLYADERDSCYDYTGTWKIVDYFSIDGILIRYLCPQEADEYIDKIIEYTDTEYIFEGKRHSSIFIESNYYTNEELKESTRASGTPGYDFSDLNISSLNVIRDVWFKIVGESDFGRWFYVLNNNRIIIQYRGYFFLADKVVVSTN